MLLLEKAIVVTEAGIGRAVASTSADAGASAMAVASLITAWLAI